MKLSIVKQSKTRHCFAIKDGRETLAYSACFNPKDGPEAVLDRLNAGLEGLNCEIVGGSEFGFQVSDVFGVLLESKGRSIYRNLMTRKLRRVKEIIAKGKFSAKK